MKRFLPYNILLALTIVVTGFTVLYNLVVRESYATTLQYHYPAIEQATETALPTPEPFAPPEPQPSEEAAANSAEDEDGEEPVTRVQFPLDINTATAEQLQFIPQVGDVMSRRIVQYREELGGYTDLEQLRNIKGVGDKTYEHLYAYLIIGGEAAPDGDPEG